MKPKQNTGKKAGIKDMCYTLPYALEPLIPVIMGMRVWESACGAKTLLRYYPGDKIETDILYGYDFFSWQPEYWDIQVTNPPFSIKYEWIARSYELGKPFALLLPLETLGAKQCSQYWSTYGKPHVILFSRRINFIMPNKGLKGSSSNFPVMWYTHKLLPPGEFSLHVFDINTIRQQEQLYIENNL